MLSIIKGPYLQWPTATSMTFMWETSEEASARVDILAATLVHDWKRYEQPEHVLFTVTEEAPARLHRVTVNGLEPGTVYFYKVTSESAASDSGSDIVESGPHPFKTAAGPGVPFSFTVTSETGGYSGFDTTGGQINTAVFEQMQRYRPDLALFVGDIVNDGQQYEDWEKFFFGPGRSFLTTTPAYCCPGNHENYAESYKDWFAFPPPSIYYSFDYGDVHFISLDATDFVKNAHYPQGAGEMSPGHAQYDFLVRDLEEAAAAKWKIVFFHYPPYVSGSYQVEAMRALCPVLERHGVDLVFNSHTIVYERSHPLRADRLDYEDGIVYIVAGGAGAMPDWLLPKREWHTSQSVAVPHFLQVVALPDRLDIRAIDMDGRLFDTLTIRKDADGRKSFF
ncbi:metallophosphoesterase [Paenibacillus sp. HJGM_3]|uniref:metallophosphoesterase n=1 Tax=Paenibacillus sp. HJGM_3 TaxID=3379816 RepID=UPI003858E56A